MDKTKKEYVYCCEKGSLYKGPCHYARYDRLFELGVKGCVRDSGTCPHQKTAYEDTLRSRLQKKYCRGD